MRWPDIFFRARKPREEKAPTFKRSPDAGPRLNSPALPTVAIKPTKKEPTEPGKKSLPGEEITAQKPAVEVTKPDVSTKLEAEAPTVITKADPVRESTRPPLEPRSPQTGPILTPTKVPFPPSAEVSPTAVAPVPVVAPPKPESSSAEAVPAVKETLPATPSPTPKPESSSATSAPTVAPTTPPAGTTRAKRKMKLTDLARMIFSHPHDPSPTTPESNSTVSPPAFTVPVPVGTLTQTDSPAKVSEAPTIDVPREEKPVAADLPKPEPEKKAEVPAPEKPKEAPEVPTPGPAPIPSAKGPETAPKPESTPTPASTESTPAKSSEKKEFLLVNGERIMGNVLSETPENIYLDHGTLGVLTLPRSQIATRPIEIILINGDRIVGDIMAETPDTLYVRHASLGMLTVPRSQRSTRVVEALLKDGDRILGEVLTETENFTVIRSATLGTVAVPHNKVAMLNRKVEQIELKSLPPSAPAIEDKPSSA